jgi:hypothetical protein
MSLKTWLPFVNAYKNFWLSCAAARGTDMLPVERNCWFAGSKISAVANMQPDPQEPPAISTLPLGSRVAVDP